MHPRSMMTFSLKSQQFHFMVSELYTGASIVAHMVKNLAAMQETWVQSLGQKDALEKGIAI